MRKTCIGLAALLACAADSRGQIDLAAFVAVPMGEFAAIDNGMAQTRFGVSGAYYKPLSPELLLGGEVGFIMNTLDRSAFAAELIEAGASEVSVEGGTYLNFPVLASMLFSPAGLSAHGISLYGAAGVDFMRMTDMKFVINGNPGSIEFDPGSAFAWAIGAQAAMGRYFFGLRYLNLGEHTIKGVIRYDGGRENITGTQEAAVMNFLVGVRL